MKKVFFAASTYAVPELIDNYLKIITEIQKNKTEIISDWTQNWTDVAKKFQRQGKLKMKESDVLKVIDRKIFFEEHLRSVWGVMPW